MSKKKEWNICYSTEETDEKIKAISRELGLLPLTAKLLYNRGLETPDDAKVFLENNPVLFHDPFLLKDMNKAVERILDALDKNEKITIYGDYDVDGVTSVSILYLYLKDKGCNVGYYIPSRNGEGYGINPSAIESLAENGTNLLITVDTGITAIDETEFAKSKGMDVIITDHHECQNTLPDCFATVNPRRKDCDYPFKELAGVGVVFKLLCSLEKVFNERHGIQKDWLGYICDTYGDLIAIGTVADVMPLTDENRLIVSLGLKLIENTQRLGLKALLIKSGVIPDENNPSNKKKSRITSTLISFCIAPRINAAGRISNATRAVELFLSESPSEAMVIAEDLCETNRMRQAEENKIMENAYKKIKDEHDFDNDYIIVLSEDNWHNGAIGIVASRITEKYNLPSILISFDGNVSKGSGRSIKGLNLVDALEYCSDLLIKYGGHELAAGLSIERENLGAFKKKINEYARTHLNPEKIVTSIDIDSEINMNEITFDNANEICLLEPFGISNPTPVFMLKDAAIVDVIPIGSNRHTKYILKKDGKIVNALHFGKTVSENDLYVGDTVDVVFNMDINEYMNTKTVQLTLRDIRPGAETVGKINKKRNQYYEIKNSDRKIKSEEQIVPGREDFISVYYAIQKEIRQGNNIISVSLLEKSLRNMNYTKIRFIIDIFRETNVFRIVQREDKEDSYDVSINSFKNKINLEKSSILKKLKSRLEK